MRYFSISGKTAVVTSVAIAILVLTTRGASQSPVQQPPPAQGKTAPAPLKVSTRIVQVNVIAQDGNGHSITGLTQEDFTLLDQGQPQQIAFFSQEETTASAGVTPAAAPPPNTFSNRFTEKAGSPTSATVILLDGLNTHSIDMSNARKQVAGFLSQIQPQDRVALYLLSSNLTILHDFTQDSSALLRALEHSKNPENSKISATEPEPADTGNADFDTAITAADARTVEFYMNDRVEQTALAIKTIADHLLGLPGRKNLIWVSSSFPINIISGDLTIENVSYVSQIEDAARSLNNANVAIYPVDARGLITGALGFHPDTVRRNGLRGAPGGTSPASSDFDTMTTLADRTGGRAYFNTNDIQGAVRKAIDDSRLTYVLGYYPSNANWDGKFHEIKVQVKKSGVHLHFRHGYYALVDANSTPQEKAQLMSDAAWSPLESTALGLTVQVQPIEAEGAHQLKALVRVKMRELRFEQIGDNWTDSLEVEWVLVGNTGKSLGTISKTRPLSYAQVTYESASPKDVAFMDVMKIMDGAVELRLVMRDTG
ncbi:MAG TPA: VWA domain-containing protein, partial [Candidatus Limnocylindrales bacterium]|nr:VWA domain-containing protein [Candidatus Limnocylindrales bacterium]